MPDIPSRMWYEPPDEPDPDEEECDPEDAADEKYEKSRDARLDRRANQT